MIRQIKFKKLFDNKQNYLGHPSEGKFSFIPNVIDVSIQTFQWPLLRDLR